VHVKAIIENDEVVLLHSIEKGPAKQSYGIYIAATAGFPEDVILVAKRKAAELESFDSSSF
jgi:DNA mismatch repair ATPase MutS